MSTCLVTGGAGFIGSHVAESLLSRGHRVVVLDDLSGGYEGNVPRGAEFVKGSILDHTIVDRVFDDAAVEYVFHLAAYAAEGLSHFIRRFNYMNNVVGSINLINAAVRRECKRFVSTASIAVYGANQLPMTEDLVPAPEDPYGVAKYAVELDLAAARRLFGLEYTIFRAHNVFGERQNLADPYRNVIGIFMRQAMTGKPMTVFGDGSQTRAFSFIDDVAPVIADSAFRAEARNEVFNVGGSEATSVGALARLVSRCFGVEPRIEYLAARKEVQHAYCGHEKAERMLGAKPRWTVEAGLDRMAAWAKSEPLREPRPFGEIEILRNMPEGWRRLCSR